jgi:hypothetical protein
MFQYYYLAEAEFTGARDLALVRTSTRSCRLSGRGCGPAPSQLNNHPAGARRLP